MLNNNRFKLLLGSCLLSASVTAVGQDCWPHNIIEATPNERFVINESTTIDTLTGLEWDRCSWGQTYSNNTCSGTPINFESWAEALLAVSEANSEEYLGFRDWRLPNIKELSSIIENQCYDPAINLTVFPETPSNAYSSNTPAEPNSQFSGRYIYFETGSEYADDVNLNINVRFIRR